MLKSFLGAIALIAAPIFACPALAGDPLTIFDPHDSKMQQAIQNAQTTLPRFLSAVTEADNSLHPMSMLKVRVSVDAPNTSSEVIWVETITRKGKKFSGHLANEPNYMPRLTKGSRITFDTRAIVDWSIWGNDGKLYGNYTTRVMLPELEEDYAENIRSILSQEPSPW